MVVLIITYYCFHLKDIMNPSIEEDQLEPLLLKLDSSINPRIVRSLLLQSLQIPRGAILCTILMSVCPKHLNSTQSSKL